MRKLSSACHGIEPNLHIQLQSYTELFLTLSVAAELPFAFGLVNDRHGNCSFTTAEKHLSECIRNVWTNMTVTSHLGGDRPRFTLNKYAGMVFNDRLAVGRVDYVFVLSWNKLISALAS